ncbi:DNA polymerase I [Anaeromyxobacter sp. Fw109-5]|uniref:DNA polymerase I n=1 Tax=Anaeromyxobacter sp. (strain Fw109-5) TaxID=404589 RepID=UPI0000ED75EA|nr:DNA polymerase I [Anaeromyxobacter sp. Fw109-5]ABS26656.1 DNA polymerase I [Anaeromyxobacter sp. Fw109-5]
MPTLTLIDGSGFVFRAYHAIPHLSTTRGTPTNAVYGFTTMLLKALREHAPTHVVLVMDAGRKSFRNEIDPAYKANRPEAPDDLQVQFPLVREVADALAVPRIEEPGVEADDVIATLASRAREQGWEVVVVTGDKDFGQLVDERLSLYDPMAEASGRGGWTGPGEVEKKLGVRPDQVIEYMAILGDKIDNVPGIPGIGEVTAAALVRHFGTVEEMLRRPEEIKAALSRGGEKVKEKIVASEERIRKNRQLVSLRRDLVLPFAPGQFERRRPDEARVRALFSELEFSRLLKDLPAPPPTPRTERAELILDAGALAAAVAALSAAPAVGVRPVLGGPAPRTDPVVGLALAGGGRAFYLPLRHQYLGAPAQLSAEEAAGALRPLLSGELPKHAHDRKGVQHALAQLGLALGGPGADTDLASRLLLPTRREHALADVARERIGCELPRDPSGGDAARKSERVPVEGLEVERVGEWAAQCAASLLDLAPALERALESEGLLPLYRDVERPLVPVLCEMERAGILVDRAAMEGMSAEFGRTMQDLEARIHAAAGHPFNIASTRELAQVLFTELALPVLKRLKTGPSTDQDVLEKLAEQHELPRLVLEHRALAKLKGTYVDALPQLVDPRDGRIHTTFHQAGAATGRLSSSDPNLQNIPVRTELSRRIRAAFVAPPGWRLLSADYSQIELRILAHYSDDPALLEAFRLREDVHTRTAAETFGVATGEVTSDMRRIAKVLNFGIAYGLSAFGLSQRLDLPGAEAQGIIDRYFARYAGVRRYVEKAVEDARATGESRTLFGRARAMPEIAARNPALRNAAERTAINTPIQGTAADIVKVAMIRVHDALAGDARRARLLLQVHDELVLEVPEDELAPVEALVRREMGGAAQLKVPLDVEVGVGHSWAEAH